MHSCSYLCGRLWAAR